MTRHEDLQSYEQRILNGGGSRMIILAELPAFEARYGRPYT